MERQGCDTTQVVAIAISFYVLGFPQIADFCKSLLFVAPSVEAVVNTTLVFQVGLCCCTFRTILSKMFFLVQVLSPCLNLITAQYFGACCGGAEG